MHKIRSNSKACLPRAMFHSPTEQKLGVEDAARTYQPIGPYLTEHQSLEAYATLESLTVLAGVVNSLEQLHHALEIRFATLVGDENVSDVIDCYNEMEAFLQGVSNSDSLTGLMASLRAEIVGMVNALDVRVTALETAMTQRPALPASTTANALYGIKNGTYVCICDPTEQLLATTRPTE